MGVRNFLIEGVSGTGKTTVCDELQRRGFHAVHGDRVLAYQGDPETGEPTPGGSHQNHIWRVDAVRALIADHSEPVTYFCGGSRNFAKFIDLFDGVFVLDVDPGTLHQRLSTRPEDEFGGRPADREFIARLHRTGEDIPADAVVVDATVPVARVVDKILQISEVDRTRA
ncbi:AAA family ATPase [Actinoplanes friuliensis]|jgi:hypothetical protein|uniref:Nucleoside kinase n=1 Tax=Actinoplanes friuliensis DSM 7358 TaxID=1246995 RepID=U5W2F3_9ACTN|nr:AAA family ATPase [Actinoplanes friuliensis]AGZ43314.1 hypothetical protein AFR_25240 [Actinoplanes friuliensis DSM 7358]